MRHQKKRALTTALWLCLLLIGLDSKDVIVSAQEVDSRQLERRSLDGVNGPQKIYTRRLYQYEPSSNYNNRADDHNAPDLVVIFLSIALVVLLLVLCIFAPLCYPLSFWDLVSVYCHWEKCPPNAGTYVNACDIMVC